MNLRTRIALLAAAAVISASALLGTPATYAQGNMQKDDMKKKEMMTDDKKDKMPSNTMSKDEKKDMMKKDDMKK